MIETTVQPVKIFKDDAKVEVSFKDEKGTTRLWTLLVKTAKYEAGMWKYQLKSKDGTTFADGEWFAEEKLDFAKD